MSYRERMEDLVRALQFAADRAPIMTPGIIHYSPQLVDMGIEMDRLYAENERLAAIVNLIELKNERDALAARVAELEQK